MKTMRSNRAELRKVLSEFNSCSDRLLKADFQDYKNVLCKYLHFLSDCPTINNYLSNCGSPTIPNIELEVKKVADSYGEDVFPTGDTEAEESANVFAILRYLADSNIEIHNGFMGYSDSKKNNDVVKAFNERFVIIMICNIEKYLKKLEIDMGVDETINYNITVTNGQLNLASDNAVIHATFNNGIDPVMLKSLVDKVLAESKKGFTEDEIATVTESVEFIQQELTQEKPKKSVLRRIIATLQGIKGSVEFLAAVSALIQFVQPVVG